MSGRLDGWTDKEKKPMTRMVAALSLVASMALPCVAGAEEPGALGAVDAIKIATEAFKHLSRPAARVGVGRVAPVSGRSITLTAEGLGHRRGERTRPIVV